MGLDKSKIIIGLPTYGHSFRLVNPFNTKLGAPAEGFGSVGTEGFVTYSEVCWFRKYNFYVTTEYDVQSCSPYLYAGLEWISYDDENSLECKVSFKIKLIEFHFSKYGISDAIHQGKWIWWSDDFFTQH